MENRRKKNYAMVKLNVPKSVILPNGRTFVAQYKRIKRSELPPNIVREELIHKGQRQEVDVEDLERNKARVFLIL